MAYANTKVAGGLGITICLLIGAGVVGWRAIIERRADVAVAQTPPIPPAKPPVPAVDWRTNFDAIYRLDPGEVVRRIAPPFIPERQRFFDDIDPGRVNVIDRAGYAFTWNGRAISAMAGPMPTQTLRTVVTYVLGVPAYAVELPKTTWQMQLSGDWVVRHGASEAERLTALAKILKRDWDVSLRFERREIERNVLVARGRYVAKAGAPVDLFVTHKNDRTGEVEGDVAGLFKAVGELVGAPVVLDRVDGAETRAMWRFHDVRPGVAAPAEGVGALIEHVAEQTGLEFKWERRKVGVWAGKD